MFRQGEIMNTLKLALTTLGIMFLGVAVFAYASGGQSPWPVQAPFDRYIDIGSSQGTWQLERDLARMHPQGSDAPALLSRLRASGMDCMIQPGTTEQYACTYRQPRDYRSVASIEVDITTRNGGRVVDSLTPAVSSPVR
ncbi:hypothetical protein EOD42_14665 [Rhodovarius crocodyli]|uniref:Uncharacterized protein n=1 Tax=Rhodovarius crocodyli TaxID=1979269 RepID=A0A437MFE5_9PROT|nr:hypothetical protein [Rhodovarius crocodyli]RVT96346.1 hypothetical protein EOD42_14665 [Rhodovarius crocodyli]